MSEHIYTCNGCGVHDFSVTHAYSSTFNYAYVLDCACEDSEGVAAEFSHAQTFMSNAASLMRITTSAVSQSPKW